MSKQFCKIYVIFILQSIVQSKAQKVYFSLFYCYFLDLLSVDLYFAKSGKVLKAVQVYRIYPLMHTGMKQLFQPCIPKSFPVLIKISSFLAIEKQKFL